MQVVLVKDLEKYNVFEHDFQTFFLLKKSVVSPKKNQKKIILIAQSLIDRKTCKLSFGFDEFIKAIKTQKLVGSFIEYDNEELVFFNKTKLKYIRLKKQSFSYIMPFLFLNSLYEIHSFKNQVVYIKPVNVFVRVKVLSLTNHTLKHENNAELNILSGSIKLLENGQVLIDTRKYLY